MKQLPDISY